MPPLVVVRKGLVVHLIDPFYRLGRVQLQTSQHQQPARVHVARLHLLGSQVLGRGRSPRTLSENQAMKPNLLRWLAMAMSAANHDSVSQEAPCARFSCLQPGQFNGTRCWSCCVARGHTSRCV